MRLCFLVNLAHSFITNFEAVLQATSEIFVEYDKSGRATCKNKKCAQKLAKGCVRFAKKFEAFDRMNVQYFHPECLIRVMMPNARNWGFTAVEEIEVRPGACWVKIHRSLIRHA